jgi:hypothetical protein
MVQSTLQIRAADLADQLSLDKSTVSRQLNQRADGAVELLATLMCRFNASVVESLAS